MHLLSAESAHHRLRPRPVHRLMRRHRPTLRRQQENRRSSRDQPTHVRQGDAPAESAPALLLLPATARVRADQLHAPGPGRAAQGPAADARRGCGAHGQVRARDSADEGAAARRPAQPLPAGQRPLRVLHRLLPPDGGPGAQHADPLLVVLLPVPPRLPLLLRAHRGEAARGARLRAAVLGLGRADGDADADRVRQLLVAALRPRAEPGARAAHCRGPRLRARREQPHRRAADPAEPQDHVQTYDWQCGSAVPLPRPAIPCRPV